MLDIEEKQIIILDRIRSVSDEMIYLFNFINSSISEQESLEASINISNKIAIKKALEQELESLTQSKE